MGLTDAIFGTPGTTNYVKSGGSAASPGYRYAQALYNYLPSIFQQQFPTYGGQLDPGLSPTMQDAIRRAQGYSQSGPSEILQGVQGTLGNFMSPSFINPWNAMMTQVPNYGGGNMDQRIYGGQPAGGYGYLGGSNSSMGGGSAMGGGGQGFGTGAPAGGGQMGAPVRQGGAQVFPIPGGGMPGGGFGGVPPLGTQAGGGAGDSMGGGGGMAGGGGMSDGGAPGSPGGFNAALGMNWNDAQKSLAQQFAGNPNGLNSALAGRYGMNQYGQQNDGRQQFMHSTDHLSALQRTLGREPTFDEVQQSLRSGPGAIEQARGLFMQDYNGSGDWGSGQKSYADLVSQHGLAKGSQMFEQQYGNGPMWAGGAPGQAPASGSGMPPLGSGGPPSGPIMAPGQGADPMNGGAVSQARYPNPGGDPNAGRSLPGAQPMGSGVGGSSTVSTVPPDPMNGSGMNAADPMNPTLSMPRTPAPPGGLGGDTIKVFPSSPTSTPGGLPPLGAKPGQTYGGITAERLNANPDLASTLGPRARGRLGLPPLGSGGSVPQGGKVTNPYGGPKGPTDIGTAKPVNPPVSVTGQGPGANANTPTARPGGPQRIAVDPPKPVRNPRTGNWHTPGAGQNRTRRNGKPVKYIY